MHIPVSFPPAMSTPPTDPLASPCVRNCCLDEDNICMGCGRSLQEIMDWSGAAPSEKTAILARSRERTAARRTRRGDR
jgi:predicted Fe-S protein YdhL (DUF1289 family)